MSLHTGLDQIHAPDLPHFSVGGILWRSFWMTVWNFVTFVGFALVIGVPVAILVWIAGEFVNLPDYVQAPFKDGHLVSRVDQTLTFLASTFISLVLVLLIQAAVVYRAFRSLGGYSVGFGDSLAHSFGVLIHLLELAVVASILLGALGWLFYSETTWLMAQGQFGISVFFGVLLLFVLVFIATGLWVVFPAIVVERIGPVAAILRSWRLTRGRRWQILVLAILFALIEWAISYVFTLEIKLTLVGPYAAVVLNVALSFFGTVVLASSYYNLVGEKDGVTALGRIFA
jgi:hypothetical protein